MQRVNVFIAQCYLQHADDDNALSCTVTLTLDKNMSAPVYVYYELNGFYQNHRRCARLGCCNIIIQNVVFLCNVYIPRASVRWWIHSHKLKTLLASFLLSRYVKSRSDMQLADEKGNRLTNLCKPQEYYNGSSNLINPCGLIAWSFFNDTYAVGCTLPWSLNSA